MMKRTAWLLLAVLMAFGNSSKAQPVYTLGSAVPVSGAACDGTILYSGVTGSNGSAVISSPAYSFTATDVGKSISVSTPVINTFFAPALGPSVNTTIASVSGGAATLATPMTFAPPADGYSARFYAHDNRSAIQAALNVGAAASGYSGNTVVFPGGGPIGHVCATSGPLTLYSNTTIKGQGQGASIIMLANGSNSSMFVGANLSTLTGTGNTGGVHDWGFEDIQLDGNRGANTASGTNCTAAMVGDGIQVYGYEPYTNNLLINYFAGDAMYTEWAATAGSPIDSNNVAAPAGMEAHIHDAKMYYNGGWAWCELGPHDSHATHITMHGDGLGGMFVFGPGGTLNIEDSHGYTNGGPDFSLQAGDIFMLNTQSEGSTLLRSIGYYFQGDAIGTLTLGQSGDTVGTITCLACGIGTLVNVAAAGTNDQWFGGSVNAITGTYVPSFACFTAGLSSTCGPTGGGTEHITGITLGNSTFVSGSAVGTVVGTISVATTGPSFSGTLSLTGTNAADFEIVGSSLEVAVASLTASSYSLNIVGTQSGATGSPFTQAVTLTTTAPGSVGQVATRSFMPNTFNSSLTYMMSRTESFARTAISSMQIVIPNWYGSETATGSASTVTAGIEYPAGTFTQVKFSGSVSGSVPSGGMLTSDPITVSIPNGAQFFVRIWTNNPSGVTYLQDDAVSPVQVSMPAVDGIHFGSSAITDQTMGGTVAQDGVEFGSFPAAIIGQTAAPGICIAGDSRAVGYADTAGTSGDNGEFAHSIGASLAYIDFGFAGSEISTDSSHYTQRRILSAYCSNMIIEYGINDLSSLVTVSQLETQISDFAGTFPSTMKKWIATLPPETSSTDGWTTLANQTSLSSGVNTARIQYNTDLRNGVLNSTPLDIVGFIDISSIDESSLNSGLWKVSGGDITFDGVHENGAGTTAITTSGIVPVSSFTRP